MKKGDWLADNARLRSALADMVEITKRNSSPDIILTAIRTCAAHALTAAAQVGETFDDGYKYKEAECRDEMAATIERCAQKIRDILKDEYGAERLDQIDAAIRKLKDEA